MLRKRMDVLASNDAVIQPLRLLFNAKGDVQSASAILEMYKAMSYQTSDKTVHKRFPTDFALRLFERYMEYSRGMDPSINQMMTLAEWKAKEAGYMATIDNLSARIKRLEDEQKSEDTDIVAAALRIDDELARRVRQASLCKSSTPTRKKRSLAAKQIF